MLERVIQKLKLLFIPSQENGYRPKFLESQVLFYCLIVLIVLKLFTIPFFIFFPKNIFFASIVESDLIKLINQDRRSSNIPPLKENPKLKAAASLKAKDMLEKDYFSHFSPEGISPWHWFRVAGYDYQIAGENLAIGFLDSEQVQQAWLRSPSHRENLLNSNYQETGIAVMKGDFQGNETTVVVQLFASPAAPAVAKALPHRPTPPPSPPEIEIKFPDEKIKNLSERNGDEEVKEIQPTLPPSVIKIETKPPAEKEERKIEKELMFRFLSFLSSDYYRLLQGIIYGFLLLIIVSLIINIFIRFDIQHPDLIFKTIAFIGLLIVFAIIDKTDILKLISRGFAIY